MKYILLTTLCLLLTSCTIYTPFKLYERNGKLMGVLPLVNGKVAYVVKVDSKDLPKEEVFKRARRWCVLAYRSSKDVLQLVDKETGEIVGKGYSTALYHKVNHTISIDVNEDYYTVTVTGLEIVTAPIVSRYYSSGETYTKIENYNIGTEKSIIELFKNVDSDIGETIKSLRQYVTNPKI